MRRQLSGLSQGSITEEGELRLPRPVVDSDMDDDDDDDDVNNDNDESPKRHHVDPTCSPRKSFAEFDFKFAHGDLVDSQEVCAEVNTLVNNLKNTDDPAQVEKLQSQLVVLFRRGVFDGNITTVKSIIQTPYRDLCLNNRDKEGITPLMLAVSCDEQSVNHELVNVLLKAGASPDIKDEKMNSSVHWAAYHGVASLMPHLLTRASELGSRNIDGDTPLHLASRSGHVECCEMLIQIFFDITNTPDRREELNSSKIEIGEDRFNIGDIRMSEKRATCENLPDFDQNTYSIDDIIVIRNKDMETCYDVAGTEVPMYLDNSKEVTYGMDGDKRTIVCELLAKSFPFFRTLVLHHPECFDHVPVGETVNRDVWEAPERLHAILQGISKANDYSRIVLSTKFEPATEQMLLRAHSKAYVDFVFKLSKTIEKAVPLTPRIQEDLLHEQTVKKAAESDTSFSKGSLQAGLRACGAVCHAIDQVVSAQHHNAFCIVRPPGHHAGIDGLLETAHSCGFCIFNNVMVGALHALEKYKGTIDKVAIVDIDVHHGNGTQEIVMAVNRKRLAQGLSPISFFSSHIFDAGRPGQGYEFYPGSGQHSDLFTNVMNVPMMPLWRRKSVKGNNSRHKFAERFYNDHFGRNGFKRIIRERLLHQLRSYNPDLILISAGFDAGYKDVGNGRYMGRGYQSGFDLKPLDFAWIAAQVSNIANLCCQGRVVSVLEGGYGKLSEASHEFIDRSTLVSNCLGHLAGLVDMYVNYQDGNQTDSESETASDVEEEVGRGSRNRKKPLRYEAKQGVESSSGEESSEEDITGNKRARKAMVSIHDTEDMNTKKRIALDYMASVKLKFAAQPRVYAEFLQVIMSMKQQSLSIEEVVKKLKILFKSDRRLLTDFQIFLPRGHKFTVPGPLDE